MASACVRLPSAHVALRALLSPRPAEPGLKPRVCRRGPQTRSEETADVIGGLSRTPNPSVPRSPRRPIGAKVKETKGGAMSLLALFIICAVVIGIGIASNLVTR